MTTVLVTGCAGFIGSHTTQALLEAGYRVVGVDNLNHYYSPAWKQANVRSLKNEAHFSFNHLDITDQEALEELFKKQEEAGQVIKKIVRKFVQWYRQVKLAKE